jgi:hypothetical protein
MQATATEPKTGSNVTSARSMTEFIRLEPARVFDGDGAKTRPRPERESYPQASEYEYRMNSTRDATAMNIACRKHTSCRGMPAVVDDAAKQYPTLQSFAVTALSQSVTKL